ncbi:MAG: 2-oxoglutarate and iron-dependent oxygenase domain-containing protein [Pseudomonadota bacterium]
MTEIAAPSPDSRPSSRPPNPSPRIAELDFAQRARDPQAFGAALVDGMRETGFIVIRNHTLPQAAIDAVEAASRDFFALPAAVKSRYAMPEHHFQRGYSPFGQESAKGRDAPDLKEFWHVGRATIPGLPGTPAVTERPAFTQAGQALFDAMDAFARTLMEAVGTALEMAPDRVQALLDNGNSILRLLHYPPMPQEEGADGAGSSVRAAAHEDINLLTLLLGAEEAGLEVRHRSGVWLPINAPTGSLVVNAGDMLDRLTGGVIPSTTHRVVNPTRARAPHSRYSMPFFLHPAQDFLLEALPKCLEMGGTATTPITAHGYLEERLREIGLKTG